MKRIITIALLICVMFTTLVPTISLAGNGDIIGYAKYTDISAYINHYPITSYNINDYTAIVAEDLENYGFDVVWDGNARALYITRDRYATNITPSGKVYQYSSVAGMDSIPYVESDIKAYVNGNLVKSFNINGRTCIYMESLADCGNVMWVPEIRAIKLWIEELPMKAYESLEEAPVTVMYSADGRSIVVENWEVDAYLAQGWFCPQSSTIDPTKPMVALTFDDGPSANYTTRVLNALDRYNARATFFVLGSLAEKNPNALLKMKELGCQIGNHTYDHPRLTKLSSQEVSSQLNRTSDIIANIVGFRPTLIRPPYGEYNQSVSGVAGAPLILWSIDTRDWESRNAAAVIDSVMSGVKDGDIILMHDIYVSTAEAAEAIIPALIEKGYQLVTVNELAYYKGKVLSAGKAYSQIRGN